MSLTEEQKTMDALEGVAKVLIERGMVQRNPHQDQRALSLDFLRSRAQFFVILCDELLRYQKIWANWEPSNYHREFPDPYLKFEAEGSSFVCGCRKRVFTVSVELPSERDVSDLTLLAIEDNVTYECDGRMKGTSGTKILIHAWTQEKLRQYLKIIMRVAGVEKRAENTP